MSSSKPSPGPLRPRTQGRCPGSSPDRSMPRARCGPRPPQPGRETPPRRQSPRPAAPRPQGSSRWTVRTACPATALPRRGCRHPTERPDPPSRLGPSFGILTLNFSFFVEYRLFIHGEVCGMVLGPRSDYVTAYGTVEDGQQWPSRLFDYGVLGERGRVVLHVGQVERTPGVEDVVAGVEHPEVVRARDPAVIFTDGREAPDCTVPSPLKSRTPRTAYPSTEGDQIGNDRVNVLHEPSGRT